MREFIAFTMLIIVLGSGAYLYKSAQAQFDSPIDNLYIPPIETGDPFEVSWRYERGVIDERIYRDRITTFIRFRIIDPATGIVLSDSPASIEQIQFYIDASYVTEAFQKRFDAQVANENTPVENGLFFLDWLNDTANIAEIRASELDAIIIELESVGDLWPGWTDSQRLNWIGATLIPDISVALQADSEIFRKQATGDRRMADTLRLIGPDVR
jgi:hypothetical protein